VLFDRKWSSASKQVFNEDVIIWQLLVWFVWQLGVSFKRENVARNFDFLYKIKK